MDLLGDFEQGLNTRNEGAPFQAILARSNHAEIYAQKSQRPPTSANAYQSK